MKIKKIRTGMLAAMLVLGMTLAACGGGSGDSALDGTWTDGKTLITINGGNYEQSVDGIPETRATISAAGGKLTLTITELYGDKLNEFTYGQWGLESKWYTSAALKRAVSEIPGENLDKFFFTGTVDYSVSGDTFVMDGTAYTRAGGAPAMSGGNSLNGRWRANDGAESVMNNGSFEDSMGGVPTVKGIYSAANGKITQTITHYHGDTLNTMAQGAGLESAWYSRDDLQSALGAPDEVLDTMYVEMTLDYSLNGDTFVIDDGAGNQVAYTRQ